MIIKVGTDTYDSTEQPILITFDEGEKELISNMLPENMKFCSFPEGSDIPEIEQFMNDDDPNQATMEFVDNELKIVGD